VAVSLSVLLVRSVWWTCEGLLTVLWVIATAMRVAGDMAEPWLEKCCQYCARKARPVERV
jgi:hypothetical protein